MLGFAYANPQIAALIQDYTKYISQLVRDETPASMEAVEKFMKRAAKDPRKKVLWVANLGVLERLQKTFPAAKVADTIIGVFDSGELLAKIENVVIVDAALKPVSETDTAHRTWQNHVYDLNRALDGAAPSYELKKFVQSEAPVRLSPAAKKAPPKDSLSVLFDPMLAKLDNPKRKKTAASLIAARLQGILTKEEWTQHCERLTKYGVPAELVKAAVRLYKDAGHLKGLQKAIKAAVADGVDLETAAKAAGARLEDIQWVDAGWPISALEASMFQKA